MPRLKRCTACRRMKSVNSFWRRAACRDGRDRWCRDCRSRYFRRWCEENRDAYNSRQRIYYRRNRERLRAYNREYQRRRRQLIRAGMWRSKVSA